MHATKKPVGDPRMCCSVSPHFSPAALAEGCCDAAVEEQARRGDRGEKGRMGRRMLLTGTFPCPLLRGSVGIQRLRRAEKNGGR